jgi:hypothetical protein
MLLGFFVGLYWGRPGDGVLYGFAFGPLLAYPYQARMYRQINAWFPAIDLIGLTAAGLLVAAQAWQLI